jgi:REP element-mobilizing transposase RayT
MPSTQRPERKWPRLPGYDYTQPGGYFVTICTHQRDYRFGDIAGGVMRLNAWGRIAAMGWEQISAHFPFVTVDVYVVMPNHVHSIIFIGDAPSKKVEVGMRHASSLRTQNEAGRGKGALPGSLGAIVGAYKSAVTRQINRLEGFGESHIWQSNYHDHIIRNESELSQLRAYVINNPAQWEYDTFYSHI